MGRIIQCVDCGGEFWTDGVYAERCQTCRIRHKRETERQLYVSPKPRRRRRRRRVKSVEEFMHDCILYNRKHGTDLNYGEYDRLLRRERGELTVVVKL